MTFFALKSGVVALDIANSSKSNYFYVLFSFVAGFPIALKIIAGDAARDPGGFDRNAFHEVMNREIVGFFNRTLRVGGDMLTKGAQQCATGRHDATGRDAAVHSQTVHWKL